MVRPGGRLSGLKSLLYKPARNTNRVGWTQLSWKAGHTVMWEAEAENSREACAAVTLKQVVQPTLSEVRGESYSLTLSRDLCTHAVASTGYHTIHTCVQAIL